MTSDARPGRALLVAALLALAAVQIGCRHSSACITIDSYKDPYFPERYDVDFASCAYRVAGGGDVHVTGRSAEPTANATGDAVSQYMCTCRYWKPHPGKTFANSTTTNATLRYVAASRDGVAVYTGTAFVFPKKTRDGRLKLNIESARLKLESRSGNLPDFLGDATLRGKLVAREDACEAAQVVREMELLAAR